MCQTEGSGDVPARASVDLAGIDPAHWAEALRRVAILEEWCATARHSKAEGKAYAERIGLSVKHFARLVAVWRKHGDVVRIAGAGTPRGTPRAPVRLPMATHQAINDAIEATGRHADFEAVRREADRRCAAAGTPTASTGMVHHPLMRARQRGAGSGTSAGAPATMLLGRVRLLLPVNSGSGIVPEPDLLLAITQEEGRIAGHRLVLDGAVAEPASELLAEMAAVGAAEGAAIMIAPDVARALRAGPGEGMRARRRSRLLSKSLGSSLAGLSVRHQGQRGPSDGGQAIAVSPDDAALAVRLAVAKHNMSRSAGPAA